MAEIESKPAEKTAAPIDEGSRLSRQQAADLLGVSIGMIQKWEDRGQLNPVRDGKRVYLPLYEVEQIKADYKPRRKAGKRRRGPYGPHARERGRIAAKVFSMFRDGKAIPDIVIELKIDPRYAQDLWDEYSVSPDERRERERLDKEEAAYRKESKTRDWQTFRLEMKRLDVKKAAVAGKG